MGWAWTQTSLASSSWGRPACSSTCEKIVIGNAIASGNIWTSTDYGANWTNRGNPNSQSYWSLFSSSTDGVRLACLNTYVFESSDSGANWNKLSSSVQSFVNLAISSDGSRQYYTVSTSSVIQTSSNYGASWTPTSSGTKVWLSNTLVCSPDGTAIAGGVTTAVWYSGNTGSSFSSVFTSSSGNIAGIVFSRVNNAKIAIVTANGYFAKSTTSISSWTTLLFVASGLTNIAASEDLSIIALSGTAGIYVSYNGGTSWTRESTTQTGRIAMSADGTRIVASPNTTGYVITGLYTPPFVSSTGKKSATASSC